MLAIPESYTITDDEIVINEDAESYHYARNTNDNANDEEDTNEVETIGAENDKTIMMIKAIMVKLMMMVEVVM